MSRKRIKIGFVGAGTMGQSAHLRNYASSSLREECEIVCARGNPAPARAGGCQTVRRCAGLFDLRGTAGEGGPGRAGGVHSRLRGTACSFPNSPSRECRFFAEKPIAGSIAAGERVVRALAENNTWLMVGYHKRSDPAAVYTRQKIEELQSSGEMGKLRYIRISMPPGDWMAAGFNDLIHSDESTTNLEQDPPPADMAGETAAAYREFVNYYIHQVNLLRFLLGRAYTVSYADPAQVLFVAHSSDCVPCTIEMAAYETTIDWHESALIAFEKGYVKLDLPAPLAYNRPGQVEIFKDPGNGAVPLTVRPTLPWVHAMRNQALNFIKAVRGEAAGTLLGTGGVGRPLHRARIHSLTQRNLNRGQVAMTCREAAERALHYHLRLAVSW